MTPELDDNEHTALGPQRAALYEVRAKRSPPFRDDKILAAWNGLAISAAAVAGRIFDERRYVDAAGHPVELPADGASSVCTYVEHEGRPVAVICHDASLADEPELVHQLVDLSRGGADHLYVARRRRLQRQLLQRPREAVDRRQRRQDVVAGDRNELGEVAFVRHGTGLLRSPDGAETNGDHGDG